jgi:hypothetical protein
MLHDPRALRQRGGGSAQGAPKPLGTAVGSILHRRTGPHTGLQVGRGAPEPLFGV